MSRNHSEYDFWGPKPYYLGTRTLWVRLPPTWRPRKLSKWVISRVVSTLNGVTLIITLLVTHLLSPLGLQVSPQPSTLGPRRLQTLDPYTV